MQTSHSELYTKIADGKDELNGVETMRNSSAAWPQQELLERWMRHPRSRVIAPPMTSATPIPERIAKFGIHYTVGYRQVVTSTDSD